MGNISVYGYHMGTRTKNTHHLGSFSMDLRDSRISGKSLIRYVRTSLPLWFLVALALLDNHGNENALLRYRSYTVIGENF